jgi:type IV pilus assembly protein PilX
MSMPYEHTRSGQRGLVLISAMLLLLVATILALSMFRSYGTQEKIAGNLREKERALHAAESAQQYAEFTLGSGAAPSAGVCNGTVSWTVGQVCTNSIGTSLTTVPWPISVTFTPQGMNVNTTSGAGTYAQTPAYYIADLGPSAAGNGEVFQIDALGYGGTTNTVAIVESTYLLIPAATSPDK